MKLSSLGYLIKEGFRNIKQNSFMSIASVLVLVSCLLLSGAAYLVFVNVEYGFEWAYDQNIAIVWATEDVDEAQLTTLGDQLRSLNNVGSVEFISKEQVLRITPTRSPKRPLSRCREKTTRCSTPTRSPLWI